MTLIPRRTLITLVLLGLFVVLIWGIGNVFNGRRVIDIWGDSNKFADDISEEINVLIMGKVGIGQGGQWHAAPDLVDTIFLVNFNPSEGLANLISLPRDLYGDFGNVRLRLNRVLRDGKVGELLAIMPEITGIEVDKYAVIDLNTLSAIVDGLKGIDVDLTENVTDPVSGFTLNKGIQHLEGEDVVWLIRNRFAPEGDFFREKNQHLVVEAIFNKFNTLSSIKKTAFTFRMLPYLSKSETNFDTGILLSELTNLEDIQFNSIVLDFSTQLLNSSTIEVEGGERAYVLIPKGGVNEYGAILKFIQDSLIKTREEI